MIFFCCLITLCLYIEAVWRKDIILSQYNPFKKDFKVRKHGFHRLHSTLKKSPQDIGATDVFYSVIFISLLIDNH